MGSYFRGRVRMVLLHRPARLAAPPTDATPLSLFTFYSPSEDDAYLRPVIEYDWSDAVKLTLGGNVLLGPDASFFGQLKNNTNVYARVRYSF